MPDVPLCLPPSPSAGVLDQGYEPRMVQAREEPVDSGRLRVERNSAVLFLAEMKESIETFGAGN